MTSFAAWAAVDPRGPTSVYFASDSRISWGNRKSWDSGRKLFAAKAQPDMFGYAGDVLFPSLILGQVVEHINHGLLFHPEDEPREKQQKLTSMIRNSFGSYPSGVREPFVIAHCSRSGDGMAARFHLFTLCWDRHRSWHESTYQLPSQSDVVLSLGSGRDSIKSSLLAWNKSESSGTSRAVFGAFCDSLRSGVDPLSGGAPQLIGMYRSGPAHTFGIITEQGPYLLGLPAENLGSSAVEWRNVLFERCDATSLARLPEAQPQPRPRRLKG